MQHLWSWKKVEAPAGEPGDEQEAQRARSILIVGDWEAQL